MAEETKIAWCDSTHNGWWGCDPVSPECDNCYAAALDRRTGGNYWEIKVAPKPLSDKNWENPVRWNKNHEAFFKKHGRARRVFCGSMMDAFDNKAPTSGRIRLWSTIQTTPYLNWLLLTKRAPNFNKFLPADWGQGYAHVWLGVSVGTRKHGIPRIEHLRNTPAVVRFLSVEPLLEDLGDLDLTGIDWVIIGGESGPKARSMNPEWALNVIRQCREQGVKVFFKQWGGRGHDKGGHLVDGQPLQEFPEPRKAA